MARINLVRKFIIMIPICVVASFIILAIFAFSDKTKDPKIIRASTIVEFWKKFGSGECQESERIKLIDANSNDSEEFETFNVVPPWIGEAYDENQGIAFTLPLDKGGIIVNDLYHTNEYPIAQVMITRNVNENILANSGYAIVNIAKDTSIAHLLELIRFVKRIGHYKITFSWRENDYQYYDQFQRP